MLLQLWQSRVCTDPQLSGPVEHAGGDADLASGAVGMAAAMEEEREAEQAARQGQQVQPVMHEQKLWTLKVMGKHG